MTPEMSTLEMLDSFILIVKGSRIIDLNELDWGDAYWQDDNHVRGLVYKVGELKLYFAHRVFTSKYRCVDPFNDWLIHRLRLIAPTLRDAMRLAYNVSEERVEKPSAILKAEADAELAKEKARAAAQKPELEAKLNAAIARKEPDWTIESLQLQLKHANWILAK